MKTMRAANAAPDEQLRRRELRTRLTHWMHDLQNELHWDTYFSRCPEAARLALANVPRIIEEALTEHEQRRSLTRGLIDCAPTAVGHDRDFPL